MSKTAASRIKVSKLEDLIAITSSMHVSIVNLDEERRIAPLFLALIAFLTLMIYIARSMSFQLGDTLESAAPL